MAEKAENLGLDDTISDDIADQMEEGFFEMGLLSLDVLTKVACKYTRIACRGLFSEEWFKDTKGAIINKVAALPKAYLLLQTSQPFFLCLCAAHRWRTLCHWCSLCLWTVLSACPFGKE